MQRSAYRAAIKERQAARHEAAPGKAREQADAVKVHGHRPMGPLGGRVRAARLRRLLAETGDKGE